MHLLNAKSSINILKHSIETFLNKTKTIDFAVYKILLYIHTDRQVKLILLHIKVFIYQNKNFAYIKKKLNAFSRILNYLYFCIIQAHFFFKIYQ